MRIKRIQIEKLFGMFDHDIPLNTSERITIIHGPNGLGKTTILRMISELFSGQFSYLQTLPFGTVTLTFDDRTRLRIRRKKQTRPGRARERAPSRGEGQQEFEIEFSYHAPKKKPQRWSFRRREDCDDLQAQFAGAHMQIAHRYPIHLISEWIPWLERAGRLRWFDMRQQDMLSFEDVLSRYGERLPFGSGNLASKPVPAWLHSVLDGLSTHFIETQRLFSTAREEGEDPRRAKRSVTVERYSADMAERIQEKLRESGSLSASLDRTFAHRLLRERVPKDVDDQRIRDKYRTQSEFRNRLMQAGLIEHEEPVPLPESKLEAADIRVLWHYMNDVDERLHIFDELLKKVELFKDIINTRFLYKQFALDKSRGFTFTNDGGVLLAPTALSSGEQHELVLAYELIFTVEPKALILIDEPELSLHVTWQHMFLDDLMRISKLVDLDFVIATHSPSIVHKRTDLMVPLEGPKE